MQSIQPDAFPHLQLKYESLWVDEDGFCWAIHYERTENISNDFLLKFDKTGEVLEKYYLGKDNFKYFDFFKNRNEVVLVSNKGKISKLDLISKSIQSLNGKFDTLLDNVFIHDFIISRNGLIWLATTNGLISYDIKNDIVRTFGNEPPFVDSRFLCLFEDENERIWTGTPLGGLHIFDPKTESLLILNSDHGLANNTVVSIVEDDEKMKWIGTYNGISLISENGKLIRNFYPKDGVANKESNRFSKFKGKDGKVYIGSVDGLTIIDTKKVKSKLRKNNNLNIYLTEVTYFDKELNKNIVKKKELRLEKNYTLSASHRNIKFNFALSSYINSNENKYEYKFENEGNSWIDLGNQNYLSLNNIPSGQHKVLIRGIDSNGNKSKIPIEINIYAKAHIYKQPWFLGLLILVLIGLAFLWVQRLRVEVRKATYKIEKDKDIIESQAKMLKDLDVAKTKFFTNISHEFKTPLTIISGTTELIRSKPEKWLEKGTEMINQNAQSLLNLINQILDLRKLETDTLSLNLVQGNIVEYLSYILESYKVYAESNNTTLHLLDNSKVIIMDYDPDKILRVVSNLLTNAIKFNSNGGDVYLQVDKANKHLGNPNLNLKIRDTGQGIPEDKLNLIFDRFYQVDNDESQGNSGSGIGLSLTKELVELMGGSITVKSVINKGTTFEIIIPITNSSKVKDASYDIGEIENDVLVTPSHIAEEVVENGQSQWDNILIIEDNLQILNIIRSGLENKYFVSEAIDGQEGFEVAIETIPDLILSDVMMPNKNGFELCKELKEDHRTSHIPIILLTAKTDDSSKLKGLEFGADAYLAKPFNQQELLIRIENLLRVRKNMQEKYLAINKKEYQKPQVELSKNELFVLKLNKIIQENLEDENFGILNLGREIGLSRSQLHNKIKALTGLSTSIYIRSLRLNKGMDLLKTTDLNISEVAYKVGFKSPVYFSNAFIKEFGFPPSKTRK